MAIGDKWDSRTYPDGCRGCGQTTYKHVGQGLCNRCYRRWAKSGLDVEEWLSDPERIATPPSVTTPDEEPVVVESPSGEIRPGSAGSPLTESGESPQAGDEKGGLLGGLFKKKDKPAPVTPPPVKKTAERRPASTRRTTAADTLGDLYGALGGFLTRSPQHAPLGRYLQWQAPAAGELLDSVVANTFIDRKMVQPAVRARGSFDVLAALFGPPALIVAIERAPQRAQALLPMLEASIRSSLPTLLPAMKKTKDREEKVNKAVKEMFPDLPDGVDPVHLIIEEMFAGWITPAEAPTDTPEGEGAPTL